MNNRTMINVKQIHSKVDVRFVIAVDDMDA